MTDCTEKKKKKKKNETKARQPAFSSIQRLTQCQTGSIKHNNKDKEQNKTLKEVIESHTKNKQNKY